MTNPTIHSVQQGTEDWLRLRANSFTASEAPAMMGCSPYMTRSDLLHQKFTGVSPDADSSTQRRFDAGHEAEEMFRPVAERIVGDDLYPITASIELDGMSLLASFDGLTMDYSIGFEHKIFSQSNATSIEQTGEPPIHHCWQIEHQLLVSGGTRVLFVTSNGIEEGSVHCWYESKPERRAALIAGWKQFAKDLADYVLPEATPAVVAEAVKDLPAVTVQISGQIDVRENFKTFETALLDFLDHKLIRDPQTDQDFADLDRQIKAMRKAEDTLNAAEAMMLAQIQSVDEAKRQKDMLAKMVRENRLMAEKLLANEKERRRAEKVAAARKAFSSYVTELQRDIDGVRLDAQEPDFAAAIKGLKTLASIQDKLDTALANGKIAADQKAADLRAKLDWVAANAAGHRALLADLQQLVAKPLDDFQLAITARIDAHRKAEEARMEAERQRIRTEEAERLEREAKLKHEHEAAAIVVQQQAPADAVLKNNGQEIMAGDFPCSVTARRTGGKPTLRLGQINERLAPISLTADGLASLGFTHAATDKSAKLYREEDFPRICAALVRHIHSAAQATQQEAAA